jgi:hypothetical protein
LPSISKIPGSEDLQAKRRGCRFQAAAPDDDAQMAEPRVSSTSAFGLLRPISHEHLTSLLQRSGPGPGGRVRRLGQK